MSKLALARLCMPAQVPDGHRGAAEGSNAIGTESWSKEARASCSATYNRASAGASRSANKGGGEVRRRWTCRDL